MIYTALGSRILLSLNPYTELPLHSESLIKQYKTASNEDLDSNLYFIAQQAYSNLRETNQSIVISGESGSGKTQVAKKVQKYLAGLGGEPGLECQVLSSRPLLEAFGNAKTLQNNNSSRFWKFLELHFDETTLHLQCLHIEHYLLEKSRIVTQQRGERNFHFFYQLCAGASARERAKFFVSPASEFKYLCDGPEIEGVDDSAMYQVTRQSMEALGFSQKEQEGVLRVVMGVLHLGNIEFTGKEPSELEPSTALQIAAKLLKLPPERLSKVLLQGGAELVHNCDAVAKEIYSKLFAWLVQRVNQSTSSAREGRTKVIGLLDFHGFEDLQVNSFEQFCVNYANEKLQQHFNQHMFNLEQQEYSDEDID